MTRFLLPTLLVASAFIASGAFAATETYRCRLDSRRGTVKDVSFRITDREVADQFMIDQKQAFVKSKVSPEGVGYLREQERFVTTSDDEIPELKKIASRSEIDAKSVVSFAINYRDFRKVTLIARAADARLPSMAILFPTFGPPTFMACARD